MSLVPIHSFTMLIFHPQPTHVAIKFQDNGINQIKKRKVDYGILSYLNRPQLKNEVKQNNAVESKICTNLTVYYSGDQ